MTRNQWESLRGVFDSVLAAEGEERDRLLANLCGTDTEFHEEVKRMIVAASDPGPLDRDITVDPTALDTLLGRYEASLQVGSLLAERFRIRQVLGIGGMGQVFEAFDEELREIVAVKTIRPELLELATAVDRLKREVQRARQVTHPNVCRIYDLFVHKEDGRAVPFLTMQLLRGETLAELLAKTGKLPIKTARSVLEQCAAALGAAQAAGLVHRDFKPGNVMVSFHEERISAVVTDFGIARPVFETEDRTATGFRGAGTPIYMAPEQVEGKDVTAAADVYSFAIVACEIITGRRPAEGGLARLPRDWRGAVQTALNPDPRGRFRSAKELLDFVAAAKRKRWLAGVFAAAALAAMVLFASLPHHPRRTELALERLENEVGVYDEPAISNDGRVLVYVSDLAGKGDLDIWVKFVGSNSAKQLTGPPFDEIDPAISPDGMRVAYRSERDSGGIYLNSTLGGEERLLVPLGRHPRFSPDNSQVAYWTGEQDNFRTPGAKSYAIPAAGGTAKAILPEFADCRFPAWSPDGKYLLVTATRDPTLNFQKNLEWWIVAPSRDAAPVNTHAVERMRALNLVPNEYVPPFWTGDRIVFSGRQGETTNLWQVHVENGQVKDDFERITRGTLEETSPWALSDGTVAFATYNSRINVWSFGPHDTPKLTRITNSEGFDVNPRVSADGSQLMFGRARGQSCLTWLKDLRNGAERQLPIPDLADAIFSPDGAKVAFSTGNSGRWPVSVLDLLTGDATTVCGNCGQVVDWSSDGKRILYRAGQPAAIYTLDLNGGRSSPLLSSANADLSEAAVSPERQRIAFVTSDGPERARIYIARLRDWTAGGPAAWRPISHNADVEIKPRWSEDGGTLYYFSTRDNFGCVWGQRVTPDGIPVGGPFAIRHFHNSRLQGSFIARQSLNLSVAHGILFMNLDEINSSLWLQRPRLFTSSGE